MENGEGRAKRGEEKKWKTETEGAKRIDVKRDLYSWKSQIHRIHNSLDKLWVSMLKTKR